MFMSVVEFIGSCMVGQLSLRKGEEAVFGFSGLEFCCLCPSMPSFSALLTGVTPTMLGAGVTIAGMDSAFCFLGFCSCWLPGRKLPTTT